MALGKESHPNDQQPMFVPPRKRQASKKSNGNSNYVDHIVNVQVRDKHQQLCCLVPSSIIYIILHYIAIYQGRCIQSHTSPTAGGSSSGGSGGCLLVEESLLKSSSLLLKKSIDNLSSAAVVADLNAIRPLAKSNDHALHELHQFEAAAARRAAHHRSKDTTAASTPAGSSCYSAESILDAKCAGEIHHQSSSHDCLTGLSRSAIKGGKKSVNYTVPSSAAGQNQPLHQSQSQRQQHHHQHRSITMMMPQSQSDLLLASGESSSVLSNANELAAQQQHVSPRVTQHHNNTHHHNPSLSSDGGAAGRQLSFSRYTDTISSVRTDSYLTMTGTVKRGRKKGQSVDLQINMSRDELAKINAAALALVAAADDDEDDINGGGGGGNGGGGGGCGNDGCSRRRSARMLMTAAWCRCSWTVGVHVLLLSVLCMPFVTLATGVYAFYMGTLTWYNMFNYLNEERSVWLRVLVSPLLVVAYPVLIVLCTCGLAVYAAVVQLSVRFHSWLNEIGDVEKGFYGWLCGVLRMSDCSPYEVVVLVDLRLPAAAAAAVEEEGMRRGGGGGLQQGVINSSTEELSL